MADDSTGTKTVLGWLGACGAWLASRFYGRVARAEAKLEQLDRDQWELYRSHERTKGKVNDIYRARGERPPLSEHEHRPSRPDRDSN